MIPFTNISSLRKTTSIVSTGTYPHWTGEEKKKKGLSGSVNVMKLNYMVQNRQSTHTIKTEVLLSTACLFALSSHTENQTLQNGTF